METAARRAGDFGGSPRGQIIEYCIRELAAVNTVNMTGKSAV